MTTVVGVDPSLTSLGLAAIHVVVVDKFGKPDMDQAVFATARVRSVGHNADTLAMRAKRIAKITSEVVMFCSQQKADLVVVEQPAYAAAGGHSHDRSGLWWTIVSVLLSAGFAVVEVNNSHRQIYATGKGRVEKDIVLAAVINRYPSADVSGNDIADAVILAAMGARHLGFPVEASLPAKNLAVMEKVAW